MARVTNEQVDYILDDLSSRGIVLEDLRDDLLDHLCCIIECEMSEDDNFYRFYESVLPRFFKESLGEIQRETDNLLRFKNFYSMIRTMKITGLLTVVFTILGAIFKTLHLPGAGVMIILGGFLFSVIFLPLLIAIKLRDEESRTDKYVLSFGFLLAIFLAVGLIFKLMHWPGATILMLSGTVGLTFIYTPLYFFTRFRRPEVRLNTIVNSVLMMACGGIFFALFNLGYSKSHSDYLVENHKFIHKGSERLFESNKILYENHKEDSILQVFRAATIQLNDELEETVKFILYRPSSESIQPFQKEINNSIVSYNKVVGNLNENIVQKIDASPLKGLSRMTIENKLNQLARIQQEIAINETRLLSMR